jgi:hypothetical protein
MTIIEVLVIIGGIWLIVSLVVFFAFFMDGQRNDPFSKVKPSLKKVAVFLIYILALPCLLITSTVVILFAIAYPVHYIFIKHEYRKSFRQYISLEE